MASFYEWQLAILVLICVGFLGLQRLLSGAANLGAHEETSAGRKVAAKLSRQYLLVYGLAMGADWLQGPYIYSVYKEQHGLTERLVALLFVLGFLTAGLSAPIVGVWADQFGRRQMCMLFCVTYASACAIIQVSYLPLLFVGRFLGGFSTAVLFSCFDSWLVSSANHLALSSEDLAVIFGHATLVNSITATLAGVASDKLVGYTGLYSSPFLASGALLLVNLLVIRYRWAENYGGPGISVQELFDVKRLSDAWSVVHVRLIALGFVQTCFEGSMYLFVFIWVPFLQEVADPEHTLPLGYIFSAFMLSMTFGALSYNAIVSFWSTAPGSEATSHDRTVALHAKLSSVVCVVGALAFLVSVQSEDRHMRFWTFCAFEACVGVYYPVQGMLRGLLVPDEHRATLTSLFRVPLNVFVVVSLMTGVESARHLVLSASAFLLLVAAVVTATVFYARARGPPMATLRGQ
ncbi:DUF791-domain-containing protein [Trametes maxima]|nr:DUF791-domain-containing protein [Trametes maxima]